MSLGGTNEETLRRTAELVRFLLAGFPVQAKGMNADAVGGMIAAYAAGLCDLEYDAVKAAMTRVMRLAKFIPTIAEIREAVVASGGARKTGAEAWGEFLKLVGRFGSTRVPAIGEMLEGAFDERKFFIGDRVLFNVISSLGWRALCLSEDQTADRARFIAAYEAIADRERKEAQASTGAQALLAATGPRPLAEIVSGVIPKEES